MELLTEELRKLLPPLYSQEGVKDPMVYARFFSPISHWNWYVTEGSPENCSFVFFGYVIGHEREWGYFLLSELEDTCGPCPSFVERDDSFQPTRFSEVERRHDAIFGR